jgi:hypothetical protein
MHQSRRPQGAKAEVLALKVMSALARTVKLFDARQEERVFYHRAFIRGFARRPVCRTACPAPFSKIFFFAADPNQSCIPRRRVIRVPVVTNARATLPLHARLRVPWAPGVPHALCWAESSCTARAHRAARWRVHALRGVGTRFRIRLKPICYSGAAPTGGPPGGRCRKVIVANAPSHEPTAAKAT